MTRRELKHLKAALQFLHDQDGGLVTAPVLHAGMVELLGENIPLADFRATVAMLDARGWGTIVPSEFKGAVRKNNPAGEAALQEMV